MSGSFPLRGVVLAGGHGTRLMPLTRDLNKHLLPVGGQPMILHPIRKLVESGVRDILVVTGPEHLGQILATVGSGRGLSCSITYRVQDEAGGIAQALALAEGFAAKRGLVVLLGDNLFQDQLQPQIEAFLGVEQRGKGARILLKEVSRPERFGVPRFDGNRIVSIVEKPVHPPSAFAVTGIYLYDTSVFDIIRGLKPSSRGELEITDVNQAYLDRGSLTWGNLDGWWTDAGTKESLLLARSLLAQERNARALDSG